MLLSKLVRNEGRGAMSRIARETGCSYATIHAAATKNKPIQRYVTAKKISDATQGRVSIVELLEPWKYLPKKRSA
jgi:hypothetical protein